MTCYLLASFQHEDLKIYFDQDLEESYICASLAEELEDNEKGLDIYLHPNGDYTLNFIFYIENEGRVEKIEKDITILEDCDCDYDICLGNDFFESNQAQLHRDDEVIILNSDDNQSMVLNIFTC